MLTDVPNLTTERAEPVAGAVARWLQPHVWFLWLALPFGLALLAVNPPFQAPDESDHYFRALQLSQGDVVGERRGNSAGGLVPNIAQAIADPGAIAFHPERKMTAEMFRRKATPLWADWSEQGMGYGHFPHTVYYAPVGYVPQALAMGVGKVLHVGPLGLLYLARLAVFALSVALGYQALRLLPAFRWTALVMLLVPMSLYLFGSAAPDGLLIGSGFLLAALVGEMLLRAVPPLPRELTLVLALCAVLATAKPVYLPLAGAAGLLLCLRLECGRSRIGFAAGFAVMCLLPLAVWSRIATQVYVVGRSDIPIDPVAQSHFVLTQPWAFGEVMAKTLWADGNGIYEWFVGTLGWGDTPLPAWYYRLFGVGTLGLMALEACTVHGVNLRARAVLAIGALASFVLILVAQYMSWSAPGAPKIEGICGRYFLPLVPFALLCLPTWRRSRRLTAVPILALALSALGAIVCLVAVYRRFYV